MHNFFLISELIISYKTLIHTDYIKKMYKKDYAGQLFT